MATLNPYLGFLDNCEEAFNFYKSVFGGEFSYLMRFKDVPAEAAMPADANESDKIMHICLPIGKSTLLMGSDWPASMGKPNVGNNISISIMTDTQQEADNIFAKLSAGGTVTMPMDKAFWGDYFGMLQDKYGLNWMISYNLNQSAVRNEEVNAMGATKG